MTTNKELRDILARYPDDMHVRTWDSATDLHVYHDGYDLCVDESDSTYANWVSIDGNPTESRQR